MRSRADTQQRLVAAAREVFAEHGIRGASVSAICARAGFTRGAFYSNHASKEELFLELYRIESDEQVRRLREAVAGVLGAPERAPDPVVLTQHLARAVAATFRLDPAWFRLTTEFEVHSLDQPHVRAAIADLDRAMRAAVEEVATEVLAAAGASASLPVAELADTIIGIYNDAVRRALLTGDTDGTVRHAIDTVIPHVVAALLTEEAR
ncbi:helix-turn-helix domain-containing protein [Nocardioides sp. WV_118_6]|uniref:TetR/AcrR family transcriptional regulator n=1 Tax=Nocardioides simplex TaxID=2045 RepID=UPI00214FDFD3|nr:TetR/AcrR family transcriptional regulator [Pimelobacter simplex]UUW88089.1 TetR/AcrR family transcriptional regulator [Pimelobacter simplex]UUW97593.1 TetR/AcrR family transcriptional regulator [Pimelobacter simplex]